MIRIFGHKNPDTDSIMSALVLENLLKEKGMDVKAAALGSPSKETKYALEYIGVEAPQVIQELPEGSEVILVDHNDPKESIDNLDNLKIVNVIDHHAIKLNTSYPLNYRAEAVGCSNTILYKMYKEQGVEISKKIGLMMLSAIISDSLLFQSPTFTQEDKNVVQELEKITGIDAKAYGLELLKAGTDLSDLTGEQIIGLDAKKKEMNSSTVIIAQVNTVDVDDVLKREKEIIDAIDEKIKAEKLDMFVLLITDIIKADSLGLVRGNKKENLEKAFNVSLNEDKAWLKGVVSRKKQVIPVLEEAFK